MMTVWPLIDSSTQAVEPPKRMFSGVATGMEPRQPHILISKLIASG